jgi:hypothetical protein
MYQHAVLSTSSLGYSYCVWRALQRMRTHYLIWAVRRYDANHVVTSAPTTSTLTAAVPVLHSTGFTATAPPPSKCLLSPARSTDRPQIWPHQSSCSQICHHRHQPPLDQPSWAQQELPTPSPIDASSPRPSPPAAESVALGASRSSPPLLPQPKSAHHHHQALSHRAVNSSLRRSSLHSPTGHSTRHLAQRWKHTLYRCRPHGRFSPHL